MANERDYDVIVIGAGLGGLLTAAQFLRRGRRVVVVERLAHPGGRFTAKTFQGAQVSTGAVHMLPFGSNGELAGMLRALGVPHRIHDAEVFASYHVRGKQYACRSLLQLAAVLGPRQFAELLRLGVPMFLGRPRPAEAALSEREWLLRRIARERSPELYAFFERMCHFALSVDLADISYPEVVQVTKNMLRYGAPGVVDGGCAALTGELERRILRDGGDLRMQHDVLGILRAGEGDEACVTGVRVRDRATGEDVTLTAPLVISNIGPDATERLCAPEDAASRADITEPMAALGEAAWPRHEAIGLKVHLLSDHSIIAHKGIMYCLDTQRIAGVVQPSNSDRRLAPPGKHLLITHQLMRPGADVNVEREAARADLRRLFGDAFGTSVTILTMSQYRGEWPVNRVGQGADVAPQTRLAGLYLVGDAVKPSGYLMVEGVAQSVNALMDVIERLDQPPPSSDSGTPADGGHINGVPRAPRHPSTRSATTGLPRKPAAMRALHWLVAPPPPNPASSRPISDRSVERSPIPSATGGKRANG